MELATIERIVSSGGGAFGSWRLLLRRREVGRIDIVFAGDPDKREQDIAPRIGECRAHPTRGWRYRQWHRPANLECDPLPPTHGPARRYG